MKDLTSSCTSSNPVGPEHPHYSRSGVDHGVREGPLTKAEAARLEKSEKQRERHSKPWVTGYGTEREFAKKVGRQLGAGWGYSLLAHFAARRAPSCGSRHRRSPAARPVPRRGSRRATSTRAGPDPPGGDEPPPSRGRSDLVRLVAPWPSKLGGQVNSSMRRFLRERGLS
jgi:hypothetical protein